MNDTRKKMLERVRAILSKTMANGCTEGEAMAALSKARELMAAYEISEVELGNGTDKGEGATVFKTDGNDPYDIKRWLAKSVGRFTRCKSWSGKAQGYAVGFAGLESDVVFANWLLDTLAGYAMRALKDHQAERRSQGLNNPRIIGASFVVGCCKRIGERLNELADAAMPTPSAAGQSLVVSRNSLITEAMAKAGIHLQRARRVSRRIDGGSFGAGRNAGEGARFDRPVSGAAGGPLRLT